MAETIRLAAEQTSLEVNAGEAGDTVITVQNLSAAVGVFTIDLEGLDPDWYSLSSNSVSLFPGDSTTATLVIMPPRLSTSLARDYPFSIKVYQILTGRGHGVWFDRSDLVETLDEIGTLRLRQKK